MTFVIYNGDSLEDNRSDEDELGSRVRSLRSRAWSATRRWQTYALRGLYVGLLLLGLAMTWGPSEQTIRTLADSARDRRHVLSHADRRPTRCSAAGRARGDGERGVRGQVAGDFTPCFCHGPDGS